MSRGAHPRACLAALLFAVAGAGRALADEAPFPGGAAAYWLEKDGSPLWTHDADRALPPASLTKLMTALLFVESGVPLSTSVRVSEGAAHETGSRLGLRAGEEMSAGDLLAATLVASANDACVALASQVAGSEASFVTAMNRRARELGLAHTHFANACGHDAPEHRSSVRDLAVLAKAALREAPIASLVRLVTRRVATRGGRHWKLENKNEIVGRYAGAVGVKSGFTPAAGKCLIALAERNGATVLLVVLNAPNRWWDSVALLDRAFALSPPVPSQRVQ